MPGDEHSEGNGCERVGRPIVTRGQSAKETRLPRPSGRLSRLAIRLLISATTAISAPVASIAQTGTWDTRTGAAAAATPAGAAARPSAQPRQRRPALNAAPAAADARTAVASAAQLTGDKSKTTFNLVLSKGVKAEIVTLANPYRVIIDMPDVVFQLPAGAGRTAVGLSQAFRYGLFAEGKARIVIDTEGPVAIARADMKSVGEGTALKMSIEIVPMDATAFGGGTGAARAAAAAALARQQKPAINEEGEAPPKSRTKPLVMIDPGHGGIDPGAIGGTNLYEKTVVLAVAKQLRASLAASGRYQVVMTRQTDVFVSLDQRLKLSREHMPDLFISLHADSIDAKNLTQAIRGASVYTLSERASDSLARLMAEKENASDLIAGLESAEGDGHDEVRSILIDLLKRETANFSADFSRTLVSRLGKAVPLSREPMRAAAFKVLKQTGSPSVLIELGYMSNDEDEKLMKSDQWQRQVSASIGQAVDHYFSRRATGSR